MVLQYCEHCVGFLSGWFAVSLKMHLTSCVMFSDATVQHCFCVSLSWIKQRSALKTHVTKINGVSAEKGAVNKYSRGQILTVL